MKLASFLSVSTGSRFRQNFLRVARANVIALALPLLATPVLTRLFTPADYGTLAIFSASLALLVSFCTWRFDWIIPNARSNKMAASLFVLGIGVLILTCITLACLTPFVSLTALEQTPLGDLGWLVFLLPVALLGSGLRAMLSGWFVRWGDLTAVSRSAIIQSIVNVGVGIGAGFMKLGALGLILATVVSTWAGIGTLFRISRMHLIKSVRLVTVRSLRRALNRHGRNAKWSTIVSLVNALSLNAPLLALAAFYAPAEVGWYALMQRLISAPAGTLSSALGQSFWSEAAEHARARKYRTLNALYVRTTRRLGLALLPVLVVCLAGPFFVGPLLGEEEWGDAGYVLIAMIPLFAGSILFSSTNHLVVLEMQHVQLIVDSLRLGLVCGCVAVCGYLEWSFFVAVALASFSSFIGHACLFVLHLRVHKNHD